jgi:hypothetical protein
MIHSLVIPRAGPCAPALPQLQRFLNRGIPNPLAQSGIFPQRKCHLSLRPKGHVN